jgi:uncharacterized membrane protein
MATKLAPRLKNTPLTRQGVRNLDQLPQHDRSDPIPVNVGPSERSLSAVGGATLAAIGLARGGCLGLGLLWTGAALMLRGATGHCPANAALGRNTAQ